LRAAVDIETATAALKRTPQPRHRQLPPPEPRDPGPDPLRLFEELRSHTDLLRGEAHLRDVARFLTAMSDRSAKVPDLTLMAARAWLAAGEVGHARHFAKRLAVWSDDTREDIRLAALEILDMTAPTNESSAPPPVDSIEPKPVVVLASEPERSAPAGASLPPYVAEPAPAYVVVEPVPPRVPSAPRMPVIDVTPVTPTPPPPEEVRQDGVRSTPPPPKTPPPPTGELPKFTPGPSEIVESLAFPPGLHDGMLADGAWPTTPAQARVAMTRLARTLGRDYRIWYGTTLKTNAIAIEFMQRHLRRRFGDAGPGAKLPKKLEAELTRHGALLSEIIARSLGGQWYDVLKEEPGHWGMLVPPSIRVWPIGRVYRFFRQGHREADLVAYYLELEQQSQGEK
jgi:hypothetical protein